MEKDLISDENGKSSRKKQTKLKRKELGLSCMLNTVVGAVLAVICRTLDPTHHCLAAPEDIIDPSLLQSLKSLRDLIFNPQQEWRTIDPSIYLSPFLDVIQSDHVHASATRVALSATLKILKLGVFDEKTPGAKEAINTVVTSISTCRLERTDSVNEDAVMMNILQILTGIMNHRASVLLSDQAVCTIVNTCFQVVQQSANRGDLLMRKIDFRDEHSSASTDTEDADADDGNMDSGWLRLETDQGSTVQTADEDVQLFALVLINSAIELSGDGIGSHSKLLRMMKDASFTIWFTTARVQARLFFP
ncbi:hypothetical protein ACFX2A_018066 [Malus domestica]